MFQRLLPDARAKTEQKHGEEAQKSDRTTFLLEIYIFSHHHQDVQPFKTSVHAETGASSSSSTTSSSYRQLKTRCADCLLLLSILALLPATNRLRARLL
jgi:hypothetical protein